MLSVARIHCSVCSHSQLLTAPHCTVPHSLCVRLSVRFTVPGAAQTDRGGFGYNALLDPHLRERQARVYFGNKATRRQLLRAGLLRKDASGKGFAVNTQPKALSAFDADARPDDRKRLAAAKQARAQRQRRVQEYQRPVAALPDRR